MKEHERLIAVCGIDCTVCPLRTADTNSEVAQHLVGWFKNEGWITEDEGVSELMQRGPYCRGCRGDRSIHWSSDCWILQCCVDDKGLAYCYECEEFPCEKLGEWAKNDAKYTDALDRLRRMKKEVTS